MLEHGNFKEDDLIVCYSPPNLLSVMPGNRVMLRSGGPEMIVVEQIGNDKAKVKWQDTDGWFAHIFDLACLTCYGAK